MEVGGARVLRSDGSRGGGRGDASSYRHTAISAREKCQLSLLLLQPGAISLTQNAYKRLATGRARRGGCYSAHQILYLDLGGRFAVGKGQRRDEWEEKMNDNLLPPISGCATGPKCSSAHV